MDDKKKKKTKRGVSKNQLIAVFIVIIVASIVLLLVYFLNDGANPLNRLTDDQNNSGNLPPIIKDEECKPGNQQESDEEIDPKCNAVARNIFLFADGSLDEDSDLKPCYILVGKYIYDVSDHDHDGEGDIRTQCAQDGTDFIEEFDIELPEKLIIGQPQWLLD